MKCWPGVASVASMTMWYSVIAFASCGRERSLRSSSAILSRRSNVFLKPQVSIGCGRRERRLDVVAALGDLAS